MLRCEEDRVVMAWSEYLTYEESNFERPINDWYRTNAKFYYLHYMMYLYMYYIYVFICIDTKALTYQPFK